MLQYFKPSLLCHMPCSLGMLGYVERKCCEVFKENLVTRGERPFGKGFATHASEQSVRDMRAIFGERIKNILQKLQQGSGGTKSQNKAV